MHADLDSLLTALYVLVDDFLPARRGAGRRPKITDAELITLAVAQIMLDCRSERRFLRLARRRLGHLFPYIPKQSGYNKRIRALAPRICLAINQLARISPSFNDRLRLVSARSPRAFSETMWPLDTGRIAVLHRSCQGAWLTRKLV